MTPKLTELIDRAATLSPQERLDLLTYLQSAPDRSETNTNRSIASKYAGSLEFTDAEFVAMLKELEEDK